MSESDEHRVIIDNDLEKTNKFQRRLLATIGVCQILIVIGAVILAVLVVSNFGKDVSNATQKLQVATQAACGQYRDVGEIKVVQDPAPSRSLVSLIADDRNAFFRAQCPGSIKPPSRFLVEFAAKYNVTLRG